MQTEIIIDLREQIKAACETMNKLNQDQQAFFNVLDELPCMIKMIDLGEDFLCKCGNHKEIGFFYVFYSEERQTFEFKRYTPDEVMRDFGQCMLLNFL